MGDSIKVIIQIPCLNEEETIAQTLADLPRKIPGVDFVEWLIIDDGCTDRTVEVARDSGADHVVSHGRNRGLAAAFMTGLAASLSQGADIIVNTDADNQYSGASIPSLVAPVVAGDYDVVVGARPIDDIDDFSATKKRLQRLGSSIVRRFSGTNVEDAASGFRAYSREAAMRVQVFGRYTYTMETIVQAGWNDVAIGSVPVGTNPKTRDSKLVRSIPSYIWRSAQMIVRTFALYKPFRFFLALGLIPFVLGLALLFRWLLLYFVADEYESRLPSMLSGIALIFIASQFWAIAFLADVLAASRRVIDDIRFRTLRRELDDPTQPSCCCSETKVADEVSDAG